MSETNYFEILEETLGALGADASNFQKGGFDITANPVDSPQAVTQALHDFAKVNALVGGWVQTTGEVWSHQKYIKDGALHEVVLCAEFAAEGVSLHVRQSGSGWILTRFERREADERGGELIETVEYMARAGFDPLIYEVAWTKERDDYGNERFIQSASRLAGGAR